MSRRRSPISCASSAASAASPRPPTGVEHPEPGAGPRQRQRMGEHWRDADAAGEQEIFRPPEAQLEMIGGRGHRQARPRRQGPHVGGAAARVLQPLDRDAIDAIGAGADDRVGADVGTVADQDANIDMAAGRWRDETAGRGDFDRSGYRGSGRGSRAPPLRPIRSARPPDYSAACAGPDAPRSLASMRSIMRRAHKAPASMLRL